MPPAAGHGGPAHAFQQRLRACCSCAGAYVQVTYGTASSATKPADAPPTGAPATPRTAVGGHPPLHYSTGGVLGPLHGCALCHSCCFPFSLVLNAWFALGTLCCPTSQLTRCARGLANAPSSFHTVPDRHSAPCQGACYPPRQLASSRCLFSVSARWPLSSASSCCMQPIVEWHGKPPQRLSPLRSGTHTISSK